MFSLLVPVYNAEKYIIPFLENIATLSIPFDEVLFYDDASTDNSVQILKEHNQTVISGNENQGAGNARNILAKLAKNNWFHFHDIDDLLHPDYLKELSSVINENHHNADVLICNVDWNDEKNNILIQWEYKNAELHVSPVAYTISHPIGGINGLYKKDVFHKIGGFRTDLKIWEDADFHVRLAMAGCKFYIVEKTLSISIRRANSLSSNQKLGWLLRLELLKQYQKANNNDLQILRAVGFEAQKASSELIILKDYVSAKRALMLSEECHFKVPASNNLLWRIAKSFLSPSVRIRLRIIQLKYSFRDTGSAS